MLGGALAFAGCDGIAPTGGMPNGEETDGLDNDETSNQLPEGVPNNSSEENPDAQVVDWVGASDGYPLNIGDIDIEQGVYWVFREDTVTATVTKAEGSDIEIKYTINQIWWDAINDVEHVESTEMVFDEDGIFTYQTYVDVYEIPSDYTGDVYPVFTWNHKSYEINLNFMVGNTRYEDVTVVGGGTKYETTIIFTCLGAEWGSIVNEEGDVILEISKNMLCQFNIYKK